MVGASPIFFGPCTLRRTWGTRPGGNIRPGGEWRGVRKNCRSLGYARDDKGESGISPGQFTLSFVIPTEAERICGFPLRSLAGEGIGFVGFGGGWVRGLGRFGGFASWPGTAQHPIGAAGQQVVLLQG
jgi:hypothetical protein